MGITSEEERDELIQFYQTEGFKKSKAEAIVERISKDLKLPDSAEVLATLGLELEEIGNPTKAGLLSGFRILALPLRAR